MKDFFELREATTGRDGVKCSSEKSQFGGYTAICMRGSKGVYSSQASYKDAETAKKHAEVYADTYYSQGDRAAQRATREFEKKNASKKYVKESVEVEESFGTMLKKKAEKTKKDQDEIKGKMKKVPANAQKESVTEGRTAEELKAYIATLHKARADAASNGQRSLLSGIQKDITKAQKELKKLKESTEVEEGKLPPHLAKFFDKDGELKKDAADRVRKGRKEKGLDPRTGKKLKEDSVELDEWGMAMDDGKRGRRRGNGSQFNYSGQTSKETERNAGEYKAPVKRAKTKFQIFKNGKALKIKGNDVVTTTQAAADKTIATLSSKDFNKGAKFTVKSV